MTVRKDRQPRGREDIAPDYGRRLVATCDREACDHAAIVDPRDHFSSGRQWPREGPSSRFRCLGCGSRRTRVRYTRNSSQANGLIPPAVIALWC